MKIDYTSIGILRNHEAEWIRYELLWGSSNEGYVCQRVCGVLTSTATKIPQLIEVQDRPSRLSAPTSVVGESSL